MKVLLDTNVLLSALLTDGLCARILRRARRRGFSFILCAPVEAETKRILKDKFGLSANEVARSLALIAEAADARHVPCGHPPSLCRDPDDDRILQCALEAGADYLVTGDADLLVLGQCRETRIFSPRDFETLFND